MRRYYRPEVQRLREKALGRFYGFDGRGHWVYVLAERRRSESTPFYVGESAAPRARFINHLKTAYRGRDADRSGGVRWRRIVASGAAIEMHAIEPVLCRVSALAREAAWARALTRAGFELENNWAEHRPSSSAKKVPDKRLLALSLNDARALNATLRMSCTECDVDVPLPWERLEALSIGTPKVAQLQAQLICPECRGPSRIGLELPKGPEKRRAIVEPSPTEVEALVGRMRLDGRTRWVPPEPT